MVDASLIKCERPRHNQRDFYSGKHKCHGVKLQIIVDYFTKGVLCLYLGCGKTHDKTLFTESKTRISEHITTLFDLGYYGMQDVANFELPHKKPKGGTLTDDEKAHNRSISRSRIVVENVFGCMKRFKILGTRYRGKKSGLSIYVNIISCIYNRLYSIRDMK